MNPEDLLKKLIAIESVSGNEKPLADFVFSLLEPFFEVKKIQVDINRFNVVAKSGNPRIYLNTHLDTVPIGKCEVKENETKIFGRGACDAKGSTASMICAALELKNEGVTNFSLFFDVGEESDFCGIKKGLPEENPAFVIIGEPTKLAPVVGQKGLLSFEIIARGKSAHGATPEKGISAIEKIVNAIIRLQSLESIKDEVLGNTVVNIGTIEGGTAANVVPDFAKITCEIRTVTDNIKYKEYLEKYFNDCEVNCLLSYNPKILEDADVISLSERLTGKKAEVKKGFTELYFWPNGIVLGPGDIAVAHTDEEYMEKRELSEAVELYKTFVRELVK